MKTVLVFVFCILAGTRGNQLRHNDVLSFQPCDLERENITSLNNGVVAELGQYPWMVYIRTTVNDSGYLRSCTGTLISERWILTTASCLDNARFTWTRFGLVNTLNPQRVTESSTYRFQDTWATQGQPNVALLSAARNVDFTSNINPIPITASTTLPSTTTVFCGFGAIQSGFGAIVAVQPAADLRCINVNLVDSGDTIIAYSNQGKASRFDLGAPLVINNQLYGILTGVPSASSDQAAVFTKVEPFRAWISTETGIVL